LARGEGVSKMQAYKHWRVESDADDQVLWLYFDKDNAHVNTIDREVMEELNTIIDSVETDTQHKGIILASAKKHGFIAGADIAQFTKFKDIDEAVNLLRKGQQILDKVEHCKLPLVAMIDGFCLGGGLEIALACRYRVVEDGSKTRLGLPEVKLGIHPGWGGTVRLPRLIGAPQAMNMILSGHTVSGKAASKLGFADVAVPKRHLVRAAKHYALAHPKPHQPTFLQNLTNKKWVRLFLSQWMRKQLRAKANPLHYPAPFDALNNWEQVGVDGQAAMEKEARSCGKLFFSETCENLVRVFFLQERLKSLGKESHFSPQHVHVIGAGTMGGDIAAWCALQGLTVTLQDRDPKLIAPAIKRAHKLYQEKLKEPHLVQKAMDRLMPDVNGQGVPRADVIIEAIFEDLKAKQDVFKMLETQAKPQAILATNTSSIPLDEINSVMQVPERLVGIHFFNPVSKMLLVEIVKGHCTDPSVFEKAIRFTCQIDRLPLPVKSSPGFLVNRILMPYLLESVNMLDEGIPAEVIDKAMVEFGMPMGPIALGDAVGLDVCLAVATHLGSYLGTKTPSRLIKMVENKKLGRKTGEGFYKYTQAGKQIKSKDIAYDKPLETISDRLILRMLDETFACLREGVVADGDLLDAGMIFGTGFAPFRGGPIHYAKSKGINDLFNQYIKQCRERGEKIELANTWETSMAAET
jgi:3-hydroxyacyl-CoA dehydrogenase / enoyl-CoA hydratase / 3-hydroxybutyryl-CoA epimerase